MTNNNASNVSVAKPKANGAIFRAPVSTTLPTDSSTALAEDFKNLGYVSEDGYTNAFDIETEEIKEWGGAVVLRTEVSRSETFALKLIETNVDTLKTVFGEDNVSATEGDIAVVHNSNPRANAAYVIETLMTGDRVKRTVIPNASISEIGDIVYQGGEAIGYEITLAALPDTDGNAAYSYYASVTPEDPEVPEG